MRRRVTVLDEVGRQLRIFEIPDGAPYPARGDFLSAYNHGALKVIRRHFKTFKEESGEECTWVHVIATPTEI